MNPTAITDEQGYRRALAEIEGLMGAGRNTPEGDRLEFLVTLVEAWECKHHAVEGGNV